MAVKKRKWNSFRVVPSHIPNEGILFVDHQRNGRSGHGGNTLAECRNGDIISFYSNVSGCEDDILGHGVAGWSEYRRSTDGAKTWSTPIVLDYSRKIWEGDEIFSALVFSVITAPNGTLIAFAIRFASKGWRKQLPPVYLLSHDNGETWSEPREVDPSATVQDISLTFDASFVHEDTVYIVFMGGPENMCIGPYTMYASTDNGETFARRSVLPFDYSNYYSTAGVLDNGNFIVYSYPVKGGGGVLKGFNQGDGDARTNEHYMPYVVSEDQGYTWSEVRTSYFAKRIRNPQLSAKTGDYYFMHGRSGSYGDAPGNFVLYSSKDGVNWDEGILLQKKIYGRAGGDKYSANEVIGKYDPNTPNRLLIQSSIVYDDKTSRVNERHWWIEKIAGTEVSDVGWDSLHEAAKEGDLGDVKWHLQNGARVDARNEDGHTPLALAVQERHKNVITCLIENGANVNGWCKYGRTPLSRAVFNGYPDIVERLLDAGADVDARDRDGSTPLVAAAANGHSDIVRCLGDKGADVNAEDDIYGHTALTMAARNGHLDIVKYLVDKGADVGHKGKKGRTPLDMAASQNQAQVVEFLAFVRGT